MKRRLPEDVVLDHPASPSPSTIIVSSSELTISAPEPIPVNVSDSISSLVKPENCQPLPNGDHGHEWSEKDKSKEEDQEHQESQTHQLKLQLQPQTTSEEEQQKQKASYHLTEISNPIDPDAHLSKRARHSARHNPAQLPLSPPLASSSSCSPSHATPYTPKRGRSRVYSLDLDNLPATDIDLARHNSSAASIISSTSTSLSRSSRIVLGYLRAGIKSVSNLMGQNRKKLRSPQHGHHLAPTSSPNKSQHPVDLPPPPVLPIFVNHTSGSLALLESYPSSSSKLQSRSTSSSSIPRKKVPRDALKKAEGTENAPFDLTGSDDEAEIGQPGGRWSDEDEDGHAEDEKEEQEEDEEEGEPENWRGKLNGQPKVIDNRQAFMMMPNLFQSKFDRPGPSRSPPSRVFSPAPNTSASLFTSRQPSRPVLSGYRPREREYHWFETPEPTPATPSDIYRRGRILSPSQSPSRAGSENDLRTSLQRLGLKATPSRSSLRPLKKEKAENVRMVHDLLEKKKYLGDKRYTKAVERAKKLWPSMRNKREKEYKKRISIVGDSEQEYRSFLYAGKPTEPTTLDEQLVKKPLTFQPQKYRTKLVFPDSHREPSELIDKLKKEDEKKEEAIKLRLRPRLPKSLEPSQDEVVNSSLRNPSFKSLLGQQEVNFESLKRLKPGVWLNDEIMNFYGELLSQRAKASTKNGRKVTFLNSYFYEKLSGEGYEKARLARWTKRMKVDIFSQDVLIFPINIGNSHWTGAAVDMARKRIEYYDSLASVYGAQGTVFEKIREYLQAEHKDKKGTSIDLSDWQDVFRLDTPQQGNGTDCGVFTCQTLESIARGRDLVKDGFEFEQANMEYFRRLMVWEIAKGQMDKRSWSSPPAAV